MRTFADGVELGPLADSAHHDRGADRGTRRHRGERFLDLDGEFPGGSEDQAADARGGVPFEQVDEGQDKREGFAASGLRGRDEVLAVERRRNRLRLDGGWYGKAVFLKIALKPGRERQFREIFHLTFEDENRRADYRRGEKGLRINFQ